MISATSAPNRKKRNSKSAKMKQNKLGLRREQWLSQVAVTNKGIKEEKSVNFSEKPPEQRDDDNSFMESPSNSSIGCTESTGRSSSSSCGFCSGNITEEDNNTNNDDVDEDDDDDDGCVDDWEAVADALAAEEEEESLNNQSVIEEESSIGQSASISDGKEKSNRAWRPDDDLRPQGLPNLGKQLSFPELDKRFSSVAIPSSCPICYEDLDMTDSNFLPCPCGFRLCLFCHKTICDGDGRCPGCRKTYERNVVESDLEGGGFTVRLARSSSMFCRF